MSQQFVGVLLVKYLGKQIKEDETGRAGGT